jgi:hypothetical protein
MYFSTTLPVTSIGLSPIEIGKTPLPVGDKYRQRYGN